MMARSKRVRALLVGGPMYDPLYDGIAAFERQTGYLVEIVARLPHPELNAYVREALDGAADIDLLSTHTKYAPSQAQWLTPLDTLVDEALLADLLQRPHELSRIDGRLVQVPRNLDVRLLHYRTDLFAGARDQQAFESEYGRPLQVPTSWNDLADVASFFARRNGGNGSKHAGFLFPGRDSGLFGTFYELLVGCGGTLFDSSLRPSFASPAGVWAATFLADLYQTRRVTPRELPDWHYDEISLAFREGHAAMVCDWPGSYHLYQNPETCRVAGRVALALLPRGPAGVRAAYAGCHSFAIPRSSGNIEGGLALLHFLTSFEAQIAEARHGSIPCRATVLQRIREEAVTDADAVQRWELLAETERIMIVPPRFALYPQCEDAIWQAVQQAMLGAMSPADALNRAAEEAQMIVGGRVDAI